tara:strand:- start:9152 stop:9976 length:825 start_codon:yes stop_codon:yes gene_type:complete
MTARFLLLISLLFISFQSTYAQDETTTDTTMTEEVADTTMTDENSDNIEASEEMSENTNEETTKSSPSFHQVLKTKFIEGGAGFMGIVLLTLILGLALCIERIIYLHAAGSANNEELLAAIAKALKNGGVDKAKEVCRNTRGPIASIFYQGLERSDKGIDAVEKSIVSYGSVQMGMLERGTTWISLFIALAPMLGFMGTVIGMIGAFDAIEAAGDISPSLVAGGIKVALLTTVFGLIVAIILQVFYNYIISKIDDIVNKMEDASIALVDMLSKK